MAKAITTRYDVAEHLRTPEEMAAGIFAIDRILKRFVLKKASVEIPDKGDRNK